MTNDLLQKIDVWPDINKLDAKELNSVFKSKLSFQIKHSIFRKKVTYQINYHVQNYANIFFVYSIRNQIAPSSLLFQAKDSLKSIFEVLNWYDGINSYLMDFISFSIRVKTSKFGNIHISCICRFNIWVVYIVCN